MKSAHQLRRWLMREIHGVEIPRRPPARASALHSPPARNYQYRAWIRSLPSAVSGAAPSQACHTGPHAVGQKASDYTCIPLTWEEHRAYDRDPQGFASQHSLDVKALVKRLNRAWFNQWKMDQGQFDQEDER
ncbi:MAG: DUF968 domain-containing protein [Acidobacteriia bacterium]|nr:DUF968 domain-containing protein [Terriglobia bacterium]